MQTFMCDGNLAKDCEVVKTTSGKNLVRFTIFTDGAFNKVTGKCDGVPLPCQAWDNEYGTKNATYLGQYGKKGARMLITGEWRSFKRTDGKGDELYVSVNHVRLVSAKKPSQREIDEITGDLEDVRSGEQTKPNTVQPTFNINEDDLPF